MWTYSGVIFSAFWLFLVPVFDLNDCFSNIPVSLKWEGKLFEYKSAEKYMQVIIS